MTATQKKFLEDAIQARLGGLLCRPNCDAEMFWKNPPEKIHPNKFLLPKTPHHKFFTSTVTPQKFHLEKNVANI